MPLTSRFDDALLYVADRHRTQARKGTEIPYLSHLLAVAGLVLEHGGDEDEAIAALLHDLIEDQGGADAREEIRRRFGERVTAIVDGCTDAEIVPKPPWRPRKEAYLAHLREAAPSVRLVSAADKLHNAAAVLRDYRGMGEALWQRFNGGRGGTLWYHRELVDAFRAAPRDPRIEPLVDELDRTVAALEALAGTG